MERERGKEEGGGGGREEEKGENKGGDKEIPSIWNQKKIKMVNLLSNKVGFKINSTKED